MAAQPSFSRSPMEQLLAQGGRVAACSALVVAEGAANAAALARHAALMGKAAPPPRKPPIGTPPAAAPCKSLQEVREAMQALSKKALAAQKLDDDAVDDRNIHAWNGT
jgi:hypothetical protein